MPNFFRWVKAKLPYIALWSNLCLGNLSRFNDSYQEICSPEDENSICDERRTNVTVEEFFTIKKQDTIKLKLPVNDFVQMCYEGNNGLMRQFINQIETRLNETCMTKKSHQDNNLSETETPKSHIHTESWSKKDRRHKNSRRKTTGRYTSATDKPLHFTSGKGSPSEQQPDTGVDHDHNTVK